MISEIAKKLRDLVFIWGTLSAIAIWVIQYVNENCFNCIELYFPEISIAAVTMVTSIVLWLTFSLKVEHVDRKLEKGLEAVHISLLKSDVDRFFMLHKDKETLSEDDMSYVYMLKDKITYYGVNSFTQRKVDHLLKKEIK